MEKQNRNELIKQICQKTKSLNGLKNDPEKLIKALNNISKDDLDKCHRHFNAKEGFVINLRKEILNLLKNDEKLDLRVLNDIINKHKEGNEKNFLIYKTPFNLMYPLLTINVNKPFRDFAKKFAENIIDDLNLKDFATHKITDFHGVRRSGGENFWFSIFNKEQNNQSSGKQLYFDITNGEISYCVYSHIGKLHLTEEAKLSEEEFNYDNLIKYFEPEVYQIKNDIPISDNKTLNEPNTKFDKPLEAKQKDITPPLNQILYGPPGTGKTYHTINKALEIIGKDENEIELSKTEIERLEREDRHRLKTIFDFHISTGQIVFTTFHQSLDYEDFIEGIKPKVPKKEDGSVIYKVEQGIFKKICLVAEHSIYIGLKRKNKTATEEDKNKAIKTLKKEDYRDNVGKPYVLIIDEINRGNVSAIFGEIITLIEKDKRLGNKESLRITLPYSKKTFGVPPNLHIIGTMNTADRSVEALDTALRRRFSFTEMMPDPKIIKEFGELKNVDFEIDLVKLLEAINERIEVLVDRDHTIGHSYFMSVKNIGDLKKVFHDKIIPLLQEYFYGDYGKMEMIIGSGFFEITKKEAVTFATKYNDFTLEGKIYKLLDVSQFDDEKMIKTLKSLLNIVDKSASEPEDKTE